MLLYFLSREKYGLYNERKVIIMFSEIRKTERPYKDDPDYRYWFNIMVDSRIGSDRWNEAMCKMDEIQAKYESVNK